MGKFLAVIIFLALLSSCDTTKPEKFEAQTPKQATSNISENFAVPKNPLIIEITLDGKIIIDKKSAGTIDNLDRLKQELITVLDKRKSAAVSDATAITIQAPKKIKYGEVVKISDLVKSIGASPVALQIAE